jgi:F-type H+-transporting ATPase subunit gamma
LGTPEQVNRVAVLSVVADRGLCGGYNTMVFRATERLLAGYERDGAEWRLFTVGKKAQSYFRYRGHAVERSFTGMSERPSFADARQVAAAVLTPFVDGEVDQVMIVSTRFLSAGSQRIDTRQLLPLVDPREGDQTDEDAPAAGTTASAAAADADGPDGYTEFEPEAAILLETLGPRAAETEIFGALLEASASEVTARQRAMAAATDNAGELIKKYSRIMNRARQDSITTEIMEIVGGAEALRAGVDDDEGGLIIETKV